MPEPIQRSCCGMWNEQRQRRVAVDDATVLIVADSHDIEVYADPRVFVRVVRRPEGAEGDSWDRLIDELVPVQFREVYAPAATRGNPRPGRVKLADNRPVTLKEVSALAREHGVTAVKRRLVT